MGRAYPCSRVTTARHQPDGRTREPRLRLTYVGFGALFAALLTITTALAQQAVTFPSAADNGTAPPTALTGYLFKPSGDAPHPALVLLHGCGGLFQHGSFMSRDFAWAAQMTQQGYVILMVDSFGPRQQGNTCSPQTFNEAVVLSRPKDAYGALAYLQAQPFVRADRVGLMGWSQGGSTVLRSIGVPSLGRPASLPRGDFRAAVAFYPGCQSLGKLAQAGWTSRIPLMVLMGGADVWDPPQQCQGFLNPAMSRGAPIDIHVYPGAYHDWDFPAEPIRQVPQFKTKDGVVPITGTDPAARADALQRVPAFFARYLNQ